MSLSPEALAQLDGLSLQEARAGLDFVPTAESRRLSVADLSADEMNSFRAWDISGVLASLNSLTFEPAGAEEVFPSVQLQEKPVLDEPTAEEAMGEVIISPAGESEEEVEERIQNRLVGWLRDVDWKNAAKEGALMLGPAIFSGILWETVPQLHQALKLFVGGGMIGGFLAEGFLEVLSQAERIHPRFAGLAREAAARRGTGLLIAQISASAGIGIVGAEGLDRLFQAHAAAQPAVIGGGSGEGPGGPTPAMPVHGGNEIGDYYHRVSDANLPQSPVVLSPQAREMAEAAQGAAAQAAAQTAEVARIAALQQGPTVAELAANMPKHTISEAIYQMIGNVPHRGEVTNVLFRAIGDKVNNLNQGAIKAAADALRPIFDNIDKVVTGSGATYTEGGRAAVEALRGFNSPEAQAIRAANMGDLEAASNLLNNVIGPVIK
ncbi:hypothetical protein HYU89_01475 [Candidatus Collierbacteria bacterium]|nr:hypothetical protein [Candidatus Collierbacteria bacterium]